MTIDVDIQRNWLIERYGSGILRIKKICKDYGVIEPDFEEFNNGFRVIIYSEN